MYLETLCFCQFDQRALVRRCDPHLREIDISKAFEILQHQCGVFNDNNKEYVQLRV